MKTRIAWVMAMMALSGALAMAQDQGATTEAAAEPGKKAAVKLYDAGRQAWYVSFPAYLFGDASMSGVQAGYQFKNLQFRVDGLLASGIRNGEMFLYAAPSLGFYVSEEWESRIRTYQGISAGAGMGIMNSFRGVNAYANLLAGIEWYVFKRKAFYFEIGTGIGYPAIENAFNGGTVIGGGLKIFF